MPTHGPTMKTNAIRMKVVVASEATPEVLEEIPLYQWFTWSDKSGIFMRLPKKQYLYMYVGVDPHAYVDGSPAKCNKYTPATVEVTIL